MTKRRLEAGVLGFGLLFLAVVIFYFRPGRRPSSDTSREMVPTLPAGAEAGQPTTILKGFDYTETLRGRPLFRIQSQRTVGFGPAAGLVPNVYALEKVTLTVYPDEGPAVTVRADRADYDRRTNEAHLKGNVHWTDERGALGETDAVEFQPSARVLLAPNAIHFSRGTFDVQARSARYDLGMREVVLRGPIRGAGTGQGSAGLSRLSADGAVYRREQSLIELEGAVSGTARDGDQIACDRLVLKTESSGQHIEWARAEGRVRGILSARGRTRLRDSRGPLRYAGDQGALFFGSEAQIRSLSLTGTPASVDQGGRRLRSPTIDISFQSGQPVLAHAQGDVRVEAEKKRSESERAAISFSGSGEIETVELTGRVRIQGEGQSAQADKAVELVSRAIWILTGDSMSSATVMQGTSRVSAARIELDEKRREIRADGNARAVFTPDPSKPKAPTLVGGDPARPTYGKAERIVLDEASRVVTLSGGATLWQDSSSVFGHDITLNDTERTLLAVGNTRAVFSPQQDRSSTETGRVPSVVTASRLIYRESESSARFEGSVTATRGTWRVQAQQGTAFLGKDGKIERVELSGDVALSDPATGRSGKADHAVEWPGEGRTVLEGSPAWLVEGDGRRVAGGILTMTDRGRTVEVIPPPGGKTETVYRTRRP